MSIQLVTCIGYEVTLGVQVKPKASFIIQKDLKAELREYKVYLFSFASAPRSTTTGTLLLVRLVRIPDRTV